jgi:hypothetical protein
MANGYVESQSSSSTAYFSGVSIGESSASMTANFINNSSTNTHTYIVNTSWGGNIANGSIPPNSSRTVGISSGFLGNNAFGYVYIGKYGPNGGLLGQADISFYTGYPDPPPTPAPSFTDTTVASGILGKSYSDGVSASTTTSYAIASGSLPTGLSLNTSSGAITGTPTVQGSFTFAITASGGGGSAGSGNLTIQVLPPGNRRNSSDFNSNLAVAKRYNGTSWINLTTMKRFNGTAWVDISN